MSWKTILQIEYCTPIATSIWNAQPGTENENMCKFRIMKNISFVEAITHYN
jgi:hypothetical protein